MIPKYTCTGIFLAKVKFPTSVSGKVIKSIDFECSWEQFEDLSVIVSIIAKLCLDFPDVPYHFEASCSSNYEFSIEGELTEDDVLPIWKDSVKNLKDKFGEEEQKKLGIRTEVPYPTEDVMRISIREFLADFNDQK